MAQGIAVPVRVVQGRTVVESGSDQIAKLIRLAVAEAASANPFNTDVGVRSPVFDLQGSAARAILDQAVRRHFDRLAAGGRADLLDLRITEDADTAETIVEITYQDLETDEQRSLSVKAGSV